MLIVSEVAEAMEAHRCNEGDERIAEELADAIIRILDTAKAMNLNIGGAVFDKAVKNDARPKMHGGKLY
jgi:NTP pyrophosphatase (non-canonical NTP hydrolase)